MPVPYMHRPLETTMTAQTIRPLPSLWKTWVKSRSLVSALSSSDYCGHEGSKTKGWDICACFFQINVIKQREVNGNVCFEKTDGFYAPGYRNQKQVFVIIQASCVFLIYAVLLQDWPSVVGVLTPAAVTYINYVLCFSITMDTLSMGYAFSASFHSLRMTVVFVVCYWSTWKHMILFTQHVSGSSLWNLQPSYVKWSDKHYNVRVTDVVKRMATSLVGYCWVYFIGNLQVKTLKLRILSQSNIQREKERA